MMTREECENRILDKLEEIETIAKEYDPNASLSIFIENGHYHVNNQYWDKAHPAIDSFRIKEV